MATKKNESPVERMQKAGLTVDQLREIAAGFSRPDFTARMRDAGLTIDDVKEIVGKSHDTATGDIGTSVGGGVFPPPTTAGGRSTQG